MYYEYNIYFGLFNRRTKRGVRNMRKKSAVFFFTYFAPLIDLLIIENEITVKKKFVFSIIQFLPNRTFFPRVCVSFVIYLGACACLTFLETLLYRSNGNNGQN